MTVEELRREADKLGYRIQRKPEIIKLADCTCGHQMDDAESILHTVYGIKIYCPICKRRSEYFTTEKKAKKAWNIMIDKEKEDEILKDN